MNLFSFLKPNEQHALSQKQIPRQIREELNLKKLKPQYNQLAYTIIVDIFKYPSTQNSEIHKLANQLGKTDVKAKKQQKQLFNLTTEIPLQAKSNYCQCCGFQVQKQTIPTCQSFQNFPKVGISAFLFFQTMKNIILMLIILTAVFCGYSFYTNYVSSTQSLSFQNYIQIGSISSKQLNYIGNDGISSMLNIQTYLILSVIIIWGVSIYLFKYFQIQSQKMVDKQTITAADFSIMIQNLPIEVTQQELQSQIQKYFYQIQKYIRKSYQFKGTKFTIQKFNKGVPFYLNPIDFQDDSFQYLQKQRQQIRQTFKQWIKKLSKNGELSTPQSKRTQKLNRYQEISEIIEQKNQTTIQKIKKQLKKQKTQITTTAFVTFTNSVTSNIIAQLHPHDFASKIRYILACCQNSKMFSFHWKNKKIPIKISRAPQPEDVIWGNLGVSFCQILLRRLLTYTITIILLGMSFFAVYGLSMLQTSNSNSFISLIISVTITLINSIIGIVIRKLTHFQRDLTESNHQTSLAIKSIFAQLINSILVPFIVNVYIQKNIYYKNGLIDDIFYLSITNAFLGPIFKIIDFYYFYTRILYSVKKQPENKLGTSQAELNDYAQLMPFQIGFQYIYVINLFLFTCFYITLQPIISIFSTLGLFFMYWAEKYVLLNRSMRSIPGSDMINAAIDQLILLGPIFLALGVATWTNFLSNNTTNLRFLINMISIAISVLFFILPFNSIYQLVFSSLDDQNLNFRQNRIILPSEYDRLNPATYQQGIVDFMKYLKSMKDSVAQGKNTNKSIFQNLTSLFQDPFKKLKYQGSRNKSAKEELLKSVFQVNQKAGNDATKLFQNIKLEDKNQIFDKNQIYQNLIKQEGLEESIDNSQSFATKVNIRPKRSKIYEKKQTRQKYNLNSELNVKKDSFSNESLFSNQDQNIDFGKFLGTDFNSKKKKVYNPYANIQF